MTEVLARANGRRVYARWEIYVATNLTAGPEFGWKYVGWAKRWSDEPRGSGWKRRRDEHKSDSNGGSHLLFHAAIRRFGFDAFKFGYVCTVRERCDAEYCESFLIRALGTYGPRGYNGHPGVSRQARKVGTVKFIRHPPMAIAAYRAHLTMALQRAAGLTGKAKHDAMARVEIRKQKLADALAAAGHR